MGGTLFGGEAASILLQNGWAGRNDRRETPILPEKNEETLEWDADARNFFSRARNADVHATRVHAMRTQRVPTHTMHATERNVHTVHTQRARNVHNSYNENGPRL